MSLVYRQQLRAINLTITVFCCINDIEVWKRICSVSRIYMCKFLLILIVFSYLPCKLTDEIRFSWGNIGIIGTDTIVICTYTTIILITDIKDFIFIHTGNTINITLWVFFRIRYTCSLLTCDVYKILLRSALNILNLFKSIKCGCIICHGKVAELEVGHRCAAMAAVWYDRTETISCSCKNRNGIIVKPCFFSAHLISGIFSWCYCYRISVKNNLNTKLSTGSHRRHCYRGNNCTRNTFYSSCSILNFAKLNFITWPVDKKAVTI